MRAYTLHEALIYGQGTERPMLCPVHGDSRPSASLNIIKQVWYCYTCGAHGSLTGEDSLVEPDYMAMKHWFEEKMEAGREYPEKWLKRFTAGDPYSYWVDRVGEAATRHFKLGYCVESDRVTYPLRSSTGRVLGVVYRDLNGSGPKYKYPKGVDMGRLLFNYTTEHRRAVLLVEGAVDAIACWNAGVEAFAIYGARLSEHQVALIDQIDPDVIYTAFDNDTAGRSAAFQVQRAFSHRLVGELTWPRSWGKDVDEIGLDHLKTVLTALIDDDVESETWKSSPSDPRSNRPALSSTSISTPRRLQITRMSA